jgi:hypothetical protein
MLSPAIYIHMLFCADDLPGTHETRYKHRANKTKQIEKQCSALKQLIIKE